MSWLKLSLDASADQLEDTEDALAALGAAALTIVPQDNALPLEPAPGEMPIAPLNRIEALFPLLLDLGDSDDVHTVPLDIEALRIQLAQTLTAHQLRSMDATFVAEQDWQQRALASAVCEHFGQRLWLLPKAAPARSGAVVRLEPGMAFGSGSHPTTRLCLEALARTRLEAGNVLDYGCGSGILAIAALQLGAASAVAVDYDPQALVATQDNASYNGIRCVSDAPHTVTSKQPMDSTLQNTQTPSRPEGSALQICLPEQLDTSARFDVVVANILANPLVELAPRLQSVLRPGGLLLLAGLLDEQATMVSAAFNAVHFDASGPDQLEEGWRLLRGVRL